MVGVICRRLALPLDVEHAMHAEPVLHIELRIQSLLSLEILKIAFKLPKAVEVDEMTVGPSWSARVGRGIVTPGFCSGVTRKR